MGKASSDHPLVVYKGKGKSKGRASSDNPRALFNKQLPPSNHSKKNKGQGRASGDFYNFFHEQQLNLQLGAAKIYSCG